MKTKIMALGILSLMSVASFSSAATLSFVAPSDTLVEGCPTPIDIMVDTQDAEANSVDLVLNLHNDQFAYNNFNVDQWIFSTYTKPSIIDGNHLHILWTTASPSSYKGIGKFWTLTITPKWTVLDLSFFMKPDFAGADSNVFDSSAKDVLTEVQNKTFTVVKGTCPVAAQAAQEPQPLKAPDLAVNQQQLPAALEKATLKNEGVVLPTSVEIPLYAIYIGIAVLLLVLIALILFRQKKNV